MTRILTFVLGAALVACNDGTKEDTGDSAFVDSADSADTGIPCTPESTRWYFDGDGDGWGLPAILGSVVTCQQPSPDYVRTTGDCDDSNPYVNPNATDPANDGIDWNCDGSD